MDNGADNRTPGDTESGISEAKFSNNVIGTIRMENTGCALVSESSQVSINSTEAFVSTNNATLMTEEANVSAEVLQLQTTHETTIKDSHVDELHIERVTHAGIHSLSTELTCAESFVTTEQAEVSTEMASVTARDATISANVLTQDIQNEINIRDTVINDLHADNAVVDSKHAEISTDITSVTAEHAAVSAMDATIVASEASIQNIKYETNINIVGPCHTPEPAAPVNEPDRRKANTPFLFKGSYEVKFKNAINKRTIRATQVGISDHYQDQNIVEPNLEVNPTLKELKHFYGGEMTEMVAEYTKESAFCTEHKTTNEGSSISPEQLIQSFDLGARRFLALVGQAGSGKTTLMKRLARDVITANGLSPETKPRLASFLSMFKSLKRRFELVYFLNIRDIPNSSSMNTVDLLFGKVNPDIGRSSLECGFKWLRKNQKKAIFFLDGLDQAQWTLNGSHNKVDYDDRAGTATVMHNLIVGNLFPGIQLVLSSREHAIATLPKYLRPHMIVALTGLTFESIQRLFTELMGEYGTEHWAEMLARSPDLVGLCSIPLFLIFNVIVRKASPQNPPQTMSGVMIQILQILMRSSHFSARDNIREIIRRLSEMAFQGTKQMRVLFTEEDLQELGLTAHQVRDLVVKIPGPTLLSQSLLEGDYRIFFSHQSIQEMLAALHIVSMSVDLFRAFVTTELHQPHWSVVRRFVCGILLDMKSYNSAAKDLVQISCGSIKREILDKSLADQLLEVSTSAERLELLGSLHEANNCEFIQRHIKTIELENEVLTASGIQIMSSVMRRCKRLELLSLKDCEFEASHLRILNANISGFKLKIEQLDLGTNHNMDLHCFKEIDRLVKNCDIAQMRPWSYLKLKKENLQPATFSNARICATTLDISEENLNEQEFTLLGRIVTSLRVKNVLMMNCGISASKVQMFMDSLGNTKISKLNLGRLKKMDFKCLVAIGRLLTQSSIDELVMEVSEKMQYCKLYPAEIEPFRNICKKTQIKIDQIDISGNANLDVSAYATVASIVRLSKVNAVEMRSCGLTCQQIKAFRNAIGDKKIRKLDISENPSLDIEGYAMLGSVVSNCAVEEFVMENCNIKSNEIRSFQESLDRFKVNKIVIGLIENMRVTTFVAIAELVTTSHVQELEMDAWDRCVPSMMDLETLCSVIGNGKMRIVTLDMNSLPNVGREGYLSIAYVVVHCRVEKLAIRNCKPTAEELECLEIAPGTFNLKRLDLGDNKNLGVKAYTALGSLILNRKIERLELRRCEPTPDELRSFQRTVKVPTKMKRLDIGDNKNLGVEGYSVFGSIVRQCRVQRFGFWLCDPNAQELRSFQLTVGDSKVKALDISYNKNIGTDGFSVVGAIVEQCKIGKLLLKGCGLKAKELQHFQKAVGRSQMHYLSISYNNGMGEEGYASIGAIVRSCKVETLFMKGCDFDSEEIKRFQTHLGQAKIKQLNIERNPVSYMGKSGMLIISEIVKHCKVEELSMEECGLSERQILQMKQSLSDIDVILEI